jgi:hypothetical protein
MKNIIVQLAKALLKIALDEGLRRGLPVVYKQLDAELPSLLLNNATPPTIKNSISSAIATTTGQVATAAQIEAVIGLYDPIQAALNRLR